MPVPNIFANQSGPIPLSELDSNFAAVPTSVVLAASTGSTLVGTIQSGAGSVARTVASKLNDTVSVKDFGAVGDGVTDDTAALSAFFAASSGALCILPAGTYKITSLLSIGTITGAKFVGVQGKTKITGAFGYGLISFSNLTDVEFNGIVFENTYTNSVLSGSSAVVYGVTVNNVRFDNCTFTVPNANTQALVVFARTLAGDTAGSINGLWIENCQFINIGQTAITLMNRGTAADKYKAASRVYIRNNYAKTLGINNSFGMFISLDGYGSEFDISNNSIEDCYRQAIENTGWWDGVISGNTFSQSTGWTKKWRALSMDGSGWGGIQNVSVKDNKIVGNATIGSYAWGCTYCDFSGNVWTFTDISVGENSAFLLYGTTYCTFNGEVYRSDSLYALRLRDNAGVTSNNQFINCLADTSTSSVNTAVINFDGATVTNNSWDGYILKGTGGSTWTNTNSAANNLVGYNQIGTWTPGLSCVTVGDLSVTVTSTGRYTRNGRLVTVTFEIDTSVFTWTTASGALRITGLPFASNTSTLYYNALGTFQGITKAGYTQFALRTLNGTTNLSINASGSGQSSALVNITDMPSAGSVKLYGTFTYEVA